MGRKAKQIFHNGKLLHFHDGNTTIRVSEDTTNRLYVLFRDKKKITTRRDKAEIAEEFFKLVDHGRWVELEQNKRHVSLASPDSILSSLEGEMEIDIEIDEQGNVTATDSTRLNTGEICKLFSAIYYQDPVKAEALSGICHLSKLSTMDFAFHGRTSAVSLDDLLECYRQRVQDDGTMKEKNKVRYVREAKSWIGELRYILDREAGKKIILLADVSKDYLLMYIHEIVKVATQPGYKDKCKWLSPLQKKRIKPPYPKKNWARQRKTKLITLLQNYIDSKHLETTDCTFKVIHNLLNLIQNNKQLARVAVKPKTKPQAIDVATFQKLFDAADLRWKTYLAVAVNCGFTLSEISDLETQDLDLAKGEMIQNRPKTDEFRAAKLHTLSCSLLKQYNDKYNTTNKSPYFFLGPNSRKKLDEDSCRDSWRTLTEKAGCAVEFRRLRKCVATVATQKGCNEVQIQLLMGHTLNGELGAYIETSIETVEPACKAVCEKYFTGIEL